MIKTMTRFRIKAGLRAAPVFWWLILGMGPAGLRASTAAGRPRAAVSLEAGMFRAGQAAFRTLYGNGISALSAHVRVRLIDGLWAAAGWRTVKAGGATAIAGPAFNEEEYALEFEMTSIRLGLRYAFDLGRIAVFAGAGGSADRYEERWVDVPGLGGSGKKAGWYAEAGGEYAVFRFLSLSLRGEYTSVPTARGSSLEPDVNLGGLEAAAGLVFRF
ncbi:MAG: hypothetical protein PHF93_10355 [Acidobacteriota bacterium]|nr:hypothetical protein [Acidobacteriota bacterium]OQB56919.1 MAG: hypothetical protein BWX98_01682 [Candidatus Aminicenantes bacterium ADurb.Bin147]HNQ81036.1 hypothetical protein [Candidatus Aminicenantes bacterium]MDD8028845.1 hypothetical protein [Acidobacteriota bacterium]MDD8034209.1 hypothetical protein [Acidobacteriota bacterium]